MIKFIIFAALAIVAVFAGPYLADGKGLVHIDAFGYIIETSLSFAIIAIVVTYILIHLIIAIISKIFNIPTGTLSFFRKMGSKKRDLLQKEIIIAFEEGNYKRTIALAHKLKDKAYNATKLLAAKSYMELEDFSKANEILDTLEQGDNNTKIAVSILKAKLFLKKNDPQSALDILKSTPNDLNGKLVLSLVYQCNNLLENYYDNYKLSGKLINYGVIKKEDENDLYKAYIEHGISKSENIQELNEVISKLKGHDKKDPKIIALLVKKFIEFGDLDEARKYTLNLLKKNMDPDFLESIASWDIAIVDVHNYLLKEANKNLIASQVNVPLLKALGNLEMHLGKIDEAKDHYKKALSLSNSKDIYEKLGQLNFDNKIGISQIQNYNK